MPKAAEPKAAEPKAAEPKAAEPKAAEPKAAEPKAAEPKAAEPKAAEPKAEPKSEPPKVKESLKAAEPDRVGNMECEMDRTLVKVYHSIIYLEINFCFFGDGESCGSFCSCIVASACFSQLQPASAMCCIS